MDAARERAAKPEDLSRLVVERLNAGNVDGLAELYEPDAVMTLPDGTITVEVARQQADGSWRWVLDQPSINA